MSCNSLIDVTTTTSTSVLANGVIPFDTIVRRRGKEVQQSQRQPPKHAVCLSRQ